MNTILATSLRTSSSRTTPEVSVTTRTRTPSRISLKQKSTQTKVKHGSSPFIPTPVVPRVLAPQLALSDSPAAIVFREIRSHSAIARDELTDLVGFSRATVNRQVASLLDAGLILERPDLACSGTVGRPRIPLAVDQTQFVTVGIHIGFRQTVVSIHGVSGQILHSSVSPSGVHEGADPNDVLSRAASVARELLTKYPLQQPLWTGVAITGQVSDDGVVDAPTFGWSSTPVGSVLASLLGTPVSVASHVEAMAAAELLYVSSLGKVPSSLFFYARESVGAALSFDGTVHSSVTGPSDVHHLPTGSTRLLDPQHSGRLDSAVSDTGVVAAARAAGANVDSVQDLFNAAREGDTVASEVLKERAVVLGRAVALISDIIGPDQVILGGQAFTDYPETLPFFSRSVTENSTRGKVDLRITAARGRVQQKASGAVSLDRLYNDPFETLRISLG